MNEEPSVSDVDAYVLRSGMDPEEQRAVDEAWRRPEPASSDGIVAAVALRRVEKRMKPLRIQAIGWTIMAVLWPASASRGTVSNVVAMVLALVVAGQHWWVLTRCRSAVRRLGRAADPVAAADRAVELRRTRHTG